MTQLDTRRAYDAPSPSDGYRILVDRFWPRGITKEDLKVDYWAKDIAPSNELRRWYHEDMEGRRAEFAERYAKELDENPSTQEFIRLVRGKSVVTLLYAARNPLGNEAAIVKEYLEGKL